MKKRLIIATIIAVLSFIYFERYMITGYSSPKHVSELAWGLDKFVYRWIQFLCSFAFGYISYFFVVIVQKITCKSNNF